jgi:hypothetical protein
VNFVTWSIRNPVPVIMMFIALVVGGLISFPKLGVQDQPDISFPFIMVNVGYAGVPPSQLETEVTRKIEDAVANIPKIRHISSTLTDGTATITADTEVSANFTAIPQRELSVTKTGNGVGTVTSSPAGIECGTVCKAGFDQDSVVTLTAEAAPGSEFLGWSGICSGTGSCKVPMSAEQSVSAQFRSIPRVVPVDRDSGRRVLAISVSGDGAGTITSDPAGIECGTSCSGAYSPATTKITLTATPDRESRFAGWSGCDSSSPRTCTVTLSSSKTVSASFAESPPLELVGVSLNGAKATLSVAVPGRGTLQAKAKQLKPASARARKAGTVPLPLSLTKAAKRALARKGTLKVKVLLTFKPAGAAPAVTLEKTLTFRAKGGKP